MKKILTFAALFAGLSISAFAQQQDSVKKVKHEVRQEIKYKKNFRGDRSQSKTPEEIAKMKTDRLDSQLKFTENQKKEVYAYQLNQANKWKVKQEARKADFEARKNEMKAEREAFMKLLTPEQQEQLKNKVAESRKDRVGRGEKNFKQRQMKRKGMDRKPVEDTNVESSNG